MASVLYSRFSNGIDVGNILPTCTLIGLNTIIIPGITVAFLASNTNNFGIDTYINNAYSFTTLFNRTEVIDSQIYNGQGILVTNPLYAGSPATTLNPVAIGQLYPSIDTVSNGFSTYFLFPGFEGYLFGNQVALAYQAFTINGQTYLFNGSNIYLADINPATNVLNSQTFVCAATGLQLLAVSPTTAFFLSTFDNGLFTFMGGRSVDKSKRLVSLPKISQGIFNTRDNTLLLDAAGQFIYARDNVWSMTPKKANQAGALRLYNTTAGLVIGNDADNWQYSYYPSGTSTIVPLTLQTAYFGQDSNERSIHPNWITAIYSETKAAMTIQITLRGFDGSVFTPENKAITITPSMYNAAGYIRFRVTQKLNKVLASSLQLMTSSKVLIQEIVAEFRDDVAQAYSDMVTV